MLICLGEEGATFLIVGGQPPRRIDIITRISGVEFDDAWRSRILETVTGLELPFLGREDLLRNKLAAARTKDLADVEHLKKSPPRS